MSDPYEGTYPPPSRPPQPASSFLDVSPGQVVLALVGGVALWLSWLGWDHQASWDAIAGVEQYPYTTLQVAGCAASIAVVAAVMGAWRQPLVSALGLTAGFVLAWSVDAGRADDTGLWLAGALALATGMAVGTVLCAGLGWGTRQVVAVLGRRRVSR